jgi:hypothetical protein
MNILFERYINTTFLTFGLFQKVVAARAKIDNLKQVDAIGIEKGCENKMYGNIRFMILIYFSCGDSLTIAKGCMRTCSKLALIVVNKGHQHDEDDAYDCGCAKEQRRSTLNRNEDN